MGEVSAMAPYALQWPIGPAIRRARTEASVLQLDFRFLEVFDLCFGFDL
jgi:hypothetical protein